jgi:hypothetical protein
MFQSFDVTRAAGEVALLVAAEQVTPNFSRSSLQFSRPETSGVYFEVSSSFFDMLVS